MMGRQWRISILFFGAVFLLFFITTSSATPQESSTEATSSITEEPAENVTVSTTPKLTGNPRKDYIYDPNLPRELNGYDMSEYPFFSRVPKNITFKCDGLHDGFYASKLYKCQVYHHCLFGTRYDFLCANYTAFDQRNFICQFISEVDCERSDLYFDRNDELYKPLSTSTTTTTLAPPPLPAQTGPQRQPVGFGGQRRPLGGRPGRRRRPFRRRRPARPAYYDYDYYDRDYNDYDYYDQQQGKQQAAPRTTTEAPPPPPAANQDGPLQRRRPGARGRLQQQRQQQASAEAALPENGGSTSRLAVFTRPRSPPKIRPPVPIAEKGKFDKIFSQDELAEQQQQEQEQQQDPVAPEEPPSSFAEEPPPPPRRRGLGRQRRPTTTTTPAPTTPKPTTTPAPEVKQQPGQQKQQDYYDYYYYEDTAAAAPVAANKQQAAPAGGARGGESQPAATGSRDKPRNSVEEEPATPQPLPERVRINPRPNDEEESQPALVNQQEPRPPRFRHLAAGRRNKRRRTRPSAVNDVSSSSAPAAEDYDVSGPAETFPDPTTTTTTTTTTTEATPKTRNDHFSLARTRNRNFRVRPQQEEEPVLEQVVQPEARNARLRVNEEETVDPPVAPVRQSLFVQNKPFSTPNNPQQRFTAVVLRNDEVPEPAIEEAPVKPKPAMRTVRIRPRGSDFEFGDFRTATQQPIMALDLDSLARAMSSVEADEEVAFSDEPAVTPAAPKSEPPTRTTNGGRRRSRLETAAINANKRQESSEALFVKESEFASGRFTNRQVPTLTRSLSTARHQRLGVTRQPQSVSSQDFARRSSAEVTSVGADVPETVAPQQSPKKVFPLRNDGRSRFSRFVNN